MPVPNLESRIFASLNCLNLFSHEDHCILSNVHQFEQTRKRKVPFERRPQLVPQPTEKMPIKRPYRYQFHALNYEICYRLLHHRHRHQLHREYTPPLRSSLTVTVYLSAARPPLSHALLFELAAIICRAFPRCTNY